MDVSTLIFWLVIGGVAGWLAGNVMTGEGFGLVGNIAVGIVGAVLGGFLFGMTTGSMTSGNLLGSLVVATVGSIILLFLAGLFQRSA